MNEQFNISASPHIRAKDSTGSIMMWVIIALLPTTLFGIWNFRDQNAWILVVVTVAAAVLTEFIYEKLMHKKVTISDFSAAVTGLLLALNLPPSAPWWMGVLGSVFAILVVKQLFGGLGQNLEHEKTEAKSLYFFCFVIMSRSLQNYSSSEVCTSSAVSSAGSSAFMLKLIFFSSSFRSTTFAVISCPIFNTSDGFSTCALEI